jgi:hypothetical protein
MANPTASVPVQTTTYADTRRYWPLVSTAQTYYSGEMIGLNTSGYAGKCDDSASYQFLGLADQRLVVPSGASNGQYQLLVDRPQLLSMTIASVSLSDIGKFVYAKFSNEVAFTAGTYGNVIGVVVARLRATEALIAPMARPGMRYHGAARVMAATGNQSLSRFDLNKTIFVPNTAALTITLPAVADTQPGDELRFVKTTSDAFAVTLDGNAAETIDGAATFAAVDAQFDTVTIVSDGSAWAILNRDIT